MMLFVPEGRVRQYAPAICSLSLLRPSWAQTVSFSAQFAGRGIGFDTR